MLSRTTRLLVAPHVVGDFGPLVTQRFARLLLLPLRCRRLLAEPSALSIKLLPQPLRRDITLHQALLLGRYCLTCLGQLHPRSSVILPTKKCKSSRKKMLQKRENVREGRAVIESRRSDIH